MRDLNFFRSVLQVKLSRLKDVTWLLNATQVRVVCTSVWGCLFQNSVPNNPCVHQLMGEQINDITMPWGIMQPEKTMNWYMLKHG